MLTSQTGMNLSFQVLSSTGNAVAVQRDNHLFLFLHAKLSVGDRGEVQRKNKQTQNQEPPAGVPQLYGLTRKH